MSRYIKKFARIGHSLGPSEERGFALWVGYDIEDRTGDLSEIGLINVDGWPEDELRLRGVTSFTSVGADDAEMREKLGLK
ncbi:MAG TPA: hypothetical protein VII12_17350 [Thermoanaerobaculia bacterium]